MKLSRKSEAEEKKRENETEPGRNREGTDLMWCQARAKGVNAPRRQQGLPESS